MLLNLLLLVAVPLVKAPGCDPSHFVSKAYQDLLGRPIDPASTNYWLGAMKNGASRTQVATEMMHSAEYKNALVRALYNSYLHRPANGSEIANVSAMTAEQIETTILGSAEYFAQRGGGTNHGFVSALYQDVLGRPADPQAVAVFEQQLGAGGSRSAIAQQVLTSAEARQRWINALSMKYLHHIARMQMPGSYEQVAAGIIGSDEYCRQ
jgi:hypothetical protein